jgi:hypothetical protein
VQGAGVFDALSAAVLAIQDEEFRADAIGEMAKGLEAVENAEARLERFDQLKVAALSIQDQRFWAVAIGGLAEGLGAIEDAGARLERFDQLKDAALQETMVIENSNNIDSHFRAIAGVIKGLEGLRLTNHIYQKASKSVTILGWTEMN